MANVPNHPASSGNALFEKLATKPDQVRGALLAFNLICYTIPIILWIVYKGGTTAVVVTSIMDVLLLIATLIYLIPSQNRTLSEPDRLRILALTVGAVIGLSAAILGMALPFTERLKPIFGANLDKWREHPGALLLCGGLLFGGLALMFAGLQLARHFERTRSEMRQLLYGYNAFLAVLFLFAILAFVNLLAYARVKPFSWFGKTRDWTSAKIYSLTPESEALLGTIKDPVTIYVMIPGGELREEITTLLDNCRAFSDQISWSFVSRDSNDKELRELQRKYTFKEAAGIVVVYGASDSAVWDFIKFDDLYDDTSQSEDMVARYNFKGESALMKSIEYLQSGKARAKIYFTQGHDELDPKSQAFGDAKDGMGVLWQRLSRGNYDFAELDLTQVDKIPEDADVVVIARPRRIFSAKAAETLQKYLDGDGKKKGKLFVLLSVQIEDGKMVKNGLESLLLKYNTRVNDDRVLTLYPPDPLMVDAVTNPESTNPAARVFWIGGNLTGRFYFRNARSVSAASDAPGGPFLVDKLVFANPGRRIWDEKNLKLTNFDQLADEYRQNIDKQLEVLSRQPICLGVAVSEPKMGARPDPHAFMGDQLPRMVVFGDANWVANSMINHPGGRGEYHVQLFSACLSWLRERPDVGIIERKSVERTRYNLAKLTWDDQLKLFFQPLGLMVLGVLGLGGAVWVARRR